MLGHYIQPIESVARTTSVHTQLVKRLHNHNQQVLVHRRNGITWYIVISIILCFCNPIFRCEGTCTNLLLCSIQGGETVRDTLCKGLFSVCCITKPVQASHHNNTPTFLNICFASVFPIVPSFRTDPSPQTTASSPTKASKTRNKTGTAQKAAITTKTTRTTTEKTKPISSENSPS